MADPRESLNAIGTRVNLSEGWHRGTLERKSYVGFDMGSEIDYKTGDLVACALKYHHTCTLGTLT